MLDASDQLFLGVDGGGSKCRVRLEGRGVSIEVVTGPANPFQDIAEAQHSIVSAAQAALAKAGLAEDELSSMIVAAGLAGINVPSTEAAMSAWDHPFQTLHLTTDIHIACLGAHGGRDGAVMIVGTGSVGYARVDEKELTLGAHGFPVGDQGSGAWLGLEAVRAALLHVDGLGPSTALLIAIEDHFACAGLAIIERLQGAKSRDYATLAPLVFAAAEAGDAVAQALIDAAAQYLSQMAARLLDHGAPSLVVMGGLAPRITPYMAGEIRARIVAAKGSPEDGALILARDIFNDATGTRGRVGS